MDDEMIIKLAGKEKVPIGTIEKDYTVTSVLFLISQFSGIDKMIFKGGTALKKVHFNDFRFSEDIDFTCLEDVSDGLYSLLDSKKNSLDFIVTGIKKETTVGNSKKFTIKYNGFKNHPNNVRVDLSLREKVQRPSRNLDVMHNYDKIQSFRIPSMSVEEIMAEKVRAVIYSGAPRHLYDLNYLFAKRISLDPALVRTKIGLYGEDFSLEKFRHSIKEIEKEWVKDLAPFLPHDPPLFNEVSSNVLQKISEIMQ
ncbi:MAG: nucleotidyl transferase AbiEii/AbiGii toxin family protein [Candidatus Nitrosotenuis sp.]|nr:nucleotidyl transferase AbiEii/AbiGii toxin family protein [Candidatus Nitrosotenuis sp.]